jgi:hypothetical protein
METRRDDNQWPLWVKLVLWGSFVSFVIVFDFWQTIPMTVGMFLGYLSIPFAMGANLFNRRRKFRWILVGVTLGLVLSSVIVNLNLGHGGGTMIR